MSKSKKNQEEIIHQVNTEVKDPTTEGQLEEVKDPEIISGEAIKAQEAEFGESAKKLDVDFEEVKQGPDAQEESEDEQPQKVIVYTKTFPRGHFSGNTALAQRALAQEAGGHLLGVGSWIVESETDVHGTTIQTVVQK
tara:strand:- start:1075 stop:1488 length:414 start_codon:yes stop_codon:yes gene_type:complete